MSLAITALAITGKYPYKFYGSSPSVQAFAGKEEHKSASSPQVGALVAGQSSGLTGVKNPPAPHSSGSLSLFLKAYYLIAGKPTKQQSYFRGYDFKYHEDTQQLWNDYIAKRKSWSEMLAEARSKENTGRAAIMRKWKVLPAGNRPKDNEHVIFRTGTDPTSHAGRGVFSDEDLTANTQKAWEQLEETVKKDNFEIKHDAKAGCFYIPGLNTVVWKPEEKVPLEDVQRFIDHEKVVSTHPEVVDPASNNPKFIEEYVLAMINKGQTGFCKPVKDWGSGYQRYETLIQLAKSTHHAIEKTGLAEQYPDDIKRLWDLCKMRKSPEELGIFKPGDDEETVKGGLEREQTRMKDLMSASFEQADQDLDLRIQDFKNYLKAHKQQITQPSSPPKSPEHYDNVEDVLLRLCKLNLRSKSLLESPDHKSFFIDRLFNEQTNNNQASSSTRRKSVNDFRNDLDRRVREVTEEVAKLNPEDIRLSSFLKPMRAVLK